jgi:hypothetical protein
VCAVYALHVRRQCSATLPWSLFGAPALSEPTIADGCQRHPERHLFIRRVGLLIFLSAFSRQFLAELLNET